jgi:nucleoid-associated protein YgaU
MFFNGSRYLKVGQYITTDAQGRTVTVKQSRPLLEVTGTFTYTVVTGDRLDLLANRFYRTPRKWWLICDANPGTMYPDALLKPGTQLIIPPNQG